MPDDETPTAPATDAEPGAADGPGDDDEDTDEDAAAAVADAAPKRRHRRIVRGVVTTPDDPRSVG